MVQMGCETPNCGTACWSAPLMAAVIALASPLLLCCVALVPLLFYCWVPVEWAMDGRLEIGIRRLRWFGRETLKKFVLSFWTMTINPIVTIETPAFREQQPASELKGVSYCWKTTKGI